MPNLSTTPSATQKMFTAIHENWRNLAHRRTFNPDILRPEIAASWQRCLSWAVDPLAGTTQVSGRVEDALLSGKVLINIARAHMRSLFQGLPGHGYLIMLYDNEGHLISLLGGRKAMKIAESLNVYTGARHSEELLGTFAPGVCLVEKRPTEVFWHEHYKEIYHGWCCSAVPLFSPNQQVVGVLDATSVDHSQHPRHTLSMVKLAARAIETDMRYNRLHMEYQKLGSIVYSMGNVANKTTGVQNKAQQSTAKVPQVPIYQFKDIIHNSQSMATIINEARAMAQSDYTVLVSGESGTGKELICQALHWNGARNKAPFVAVNCAGLPRELVQSELFGYEGGAFTGANRTGKSGKFELAQNGTLFLDEIGDMPLEAQANLLRVLQEKTITRIGGSPKPSNARVIAATNKDLLQEVSAGRFRQDLYYRLSSLSLHIPALRERQEDIWHLLQHFVHKHSAMGSKQVPVFSAQAHSAILNYAWPGNVRELENTVISIMSKPAYHKIMLDNLPDKIKNSTSNGQSAYSTSRKAEKQNIVDTLAYCGGRIDDAVVMLGISRATLYRKIKKYDLRQK